MPAASRGRYNLAAAARLVLDAIRFDDASCPAEVGAED